jgi:S-adenosylmethionine:tRNA ribosyltransferase-isomerase
MRVAELRYELPEAAIAQHPVEPRDAARLLTALRGEAIAHRIVRDMPTLVGPGDVLVVNDTRVIPARLHLRKATGGAVEVLLLAPADGAHRQWEALVRPSKRVPEGAELLDDAGRPALRVGAVMSDDGSRFVELLDEASIDELGVMPLPPYIHEPLEDPDRYQTVYARDPGSVAAPTAGLHFTDEVLDACRAQGAQVVAVTLDVGLGTFRPMTTERVEDHAMHAERYRIPAATIEAIAGAGRVVAIGTTALRTLEAWGATGATEGETRLFIHGDYRFRVVDRLLTNFHLPGSSLLALLDSFTKGEWRDLYATALREGYRFLSFGDAMLVDRAL